MTVREALQQSAEELERQAEAHRRLMARAMGGEDAGLYACRLVDCPYRRRLRDTLKDAITVLEESRRAFKSKQLEVLRKKLIGVLAENA
jgi:hypothetical protein